MIESGRPVIYLPGKRFVLVELNQQHWLGVKSTHLSALLVQSARIQGHDQIR